jgi:hypothetical protein
MEKIDCIIIKNIVTFLNLILYWLKLLMRCENDGEFRLPKIELYQSK